MQIESILAQKSDTILFYAEVPLENARLVVYEPPLVVKGKYKTISEAKNVTPEDLFASINSANSKAWLKYNSPSDSIASEDRLKKIKEFDREKNYDSLIHKFEFTYERKPTAIIKYWPVTGGKHSRFFTLICQKNDQTWQRVTIEGLDLFGFLVIGRLKSHVLSALLTGSKTENQKLNSLILETRDANNFLDVNKLFGVYRKWAKNNDKSSITEFCDDVK